MASNGQLGAKEGRVRGRGGRDGEHRLWGDFLTRAAPNIKGFLCVSPWSESAHGHGQCQESGLTDEHDGKN